MARRKIATDAKKVRGNAGKRKLADNPKPAAAGPEPPVWVRKDPIAVAEWATQVSERMRLGLHTRLDVNALGRYCCLHALWLDDLDTVRKEGTTQEGKNGQKKHVAYMRLIEVDKALHTSDVEMGGTPKARNSLHVPSRMADPDEEKEREFFPKG